LLRGGHGSPLEPLAVEGWRWALIAGAILSAVTAVLFFLVPESPRWLAVLRRSDQAGLAFQRFQAAAGMMPPPFTTEPASADSVALDHGMSESGFAVIRQTPRLQRRMVLLAASLACIIPRPTASWRSPMPPTTSRRTMPPASQACRPLHRQPTTRSPSTSLLRGQNWIFGGCAVGQYGFHPGAFT
jgi:hypothetical protein